jgi:trehalose 6-phosphate phosphatase
VTPSALQREAITTVVRRARTSGLFFDFDGTLAPIQEDPATVQPISGAPQALSELAGRLRRVGIVSARPVAFLEQHFSDRAIALFGVYGLECRDIDGGTIVDPAAQQWLPILQDLVRRATDELPAPVLVENKRLSVGLHYRTAPHLQSAVTEWAKANAGGTGLRIQLGRMVVELLPPLEFDKGAVIRRQIADLDCAWYFGDDIGDIPAYRALTDRVAGDPDFAALRVAVANPETGDALQDIVDLVMPSQPAVIALVREVAAALQDSYSAEDRLPT